jgi:hypothetical protein
MQSKLSKILVDIVFKMDHPGAMQLIFVEHQEFCALPYQIELGTIFLPKKHARALLDDRLEQYSSPPSEQHSVGTIFLQSSPGKSVYTFDIGCARIIKKKLVPEA